MRTQHVVGALDQQPTQHAISALRDPQLSVDLSRLVLARYHAEVGAHVTAAGEALWVVDDQHVRQRGQRPHAGDLAQSLRCGMDVPAESRDLLVVAIDRLRESLDRIEERRQRHLELIRHGPPSATVEARGGARGQSVPEGLDRAAGGIQGVAEDSADDEETQKRLRDNWRTEETGYQRIQGSRPQTLAYGLTVSPAGLAGWIVEKWRAWSDCEGDLESRFTKDELLTTIALYWFTETIHSSTRFYYESAHDDRNRVGGQIETPSGYAIFPGMVQTRERLAEDCNLVHWSEFDRGGHFAAFEEPELIVQDLRDFFRPLR